MNYILTNDTHGTTITLRTKTGLLSRRQIDRARSELCGVDGCTCGGYLGESGPQTVNITESPCGGLSLSVLFEMECICSYCLKSYGFKEGTGKTHGICQACVELTTVDMDNGGDCDPDTIRAMADLRLPACQRAIGL